MNHSEKLRLHRWRDVEPRIFTPEQREAARAWAEQETAKLRGGAVPAPLRNQGEAENPAEALLRRIAAGENVSWELLVAVLRVWLELQPDGAQAIHIIDETPHALSAALDLAEQILHQERAIETRGKSEWVPDESSMVHGT